MTLTKEMLDDLERRLRNWANAGRIDWCDWEPLVEAARQWLRDKK